MKTFLSIHPQFIKDTSGKKTVVLSKKRILDSDGRTGRAGGYPSREDKKNDFGERILMKEALNMLDQE